MDDDDDVDEYGFDKYEDDEVVRDGICPECGAELVEDGMLMDGSCRCLECGNVVEIDDGDGLDEDDDTGVDEEYEGEDDEEENWEN